jgi:DNA (cytosine-5)-methyltransferase 1
VDNPFESPAVISFCPGILGIERGLKRAGIHSRVMAYVEIEALICANLVAGMEAGILDPAPIWTDAKTFDARPFRGRIHGIIGGYPCPGESLAGLREGHLYKGFLWPYLRRAIPATRPLFCFFENVDDHFTGTYPIVQRSLRNMGYRVEAGVYSAEEVGATHERQRLFILAVANGYGYGHGTGTGQTTGKSSSNESKEQRKEWNEILGQWMWDVIGDSGKKLAHSYSSGQPQQRVNGKQNEANHSRIGDTSTTLWPAGQGYYQYEWEEPRTIESSLGGYVAGNPNGIDILHVNQVYATYTTEKTRAIKTLSELWTAIEQKKDKWEIGRLWSFLEKEILLTNLPGKLQNQRFTIAITRIKSLSQLQESGVREMWIEQAIGSTPQGQEYFKQLQGEFADAMCILSYQTTLAGRQETKSGSYYETVQYLWDNYQNAWWDVPETLSEIKAAWQSLSQKSSWKGQIECAYKSYRLELFGNVFGYNFREDLLRALGNSVVEQTAELAFIDLLQKHLKCL